MDKSRLNNGGFVPYKQYNPPFVTEDMKVTMTMLKHHIMPDSADLDALAEAVAEALKARQKGQANEPLCQLQALPKLPAPMLSENGLGEACEEKKDKNEPRKRFMNKKNPVALVVTGIRFNLFQIRSDDFFNQR